MAFKRVVVTLHSIKNTGTGPDPGDELEIFGRISVGKLVFVPEIGQTVAGNVKNVFDHASDQTLEIPQGFAFNFPPAHRHELDISDGQQLQITGRIGEQDDIGENDFFPNIDIKKSFAGITTETLIIPLNESGQKIEINMSTVVAA
ncbi:hypothetical protein, partial [Nocardia sp. NPDC057030]